MLALVFVTLWSTGFFVARLVTPHADPLVFLAVRFALASAILGTVAAAFGASWPKGARGWAETIAIGLLLQAAYLGGVFWGVSRGVPSGIAALITAAQPLLTAAVAGPLLQERVSPRRWIGVAFGFAGVALVLAPRLGGSDSYPAAGVLAAMGGTLAFTAATIWQKRRGAGLDLRTATAIHYGASAMALAAVAALLGESRFDFTPELLVGLGWSVLALSMGAVGLLLWMIRRGAVVAVSALLFLAPPLTSLMGHLWFGESLAAVQIGGMALAAFGVALASRP